MKRRMIKPRTPRYRWIFLQREVAGTVDAYGEPTEAFTFVSSGYFAFEKAKKPIEVVDGGATVSDQQFLLMGAYSNHHARGITSDLIAWCPALDNLVVELLGDPIDPDGYQEKLWIYAMRNVERKYTTGSFPTS